jgi:hypothetical protein
MAVQSGAYKHPNSTAYSQGMRDVIDACLKVDSRERPDIHKVRSPFVYCTHEGSGPESVASFTAYRDDGCGFEDPFVMF